jgi:beta-phosphoglucomutase-like phosphatase (HAD superfamily)
VLNNQNQDDSLHTYEKIRLPSPNTRSALDPLVVSGLTVPIEEWHIDSGRIQAFFFDVDSTLFRSEPLHDIGHRRLVSEKYLRLPVGQLWPREFWEQWFVSDSPEHPFTPGNVALQTDTLHFDSVLTEGSCFFRAENEVVQRLHCRLAILAELKLADVPPGIAGRFYTVDQYKEAKKTLMIDSLTAKDSPYSIELIPGAKEIFDAVLQRRIPFALGTGSPESVVRAMFETIDSWQHITHRVTADDLWRPDQGIERKGKPDPATYNMCWERLRNTHAELTCREQVIVLEDQAKGAHSARRGGFTAILCPDPTNNRSIESHVEELMELESAHPCNEAPPIVVARDIEQGWMPFLNKLFQGP